MLFGEDLEKLRDPKSADTTLLAYLGDAVYELYVRSAGTAKAGPGMKARDMNRFAVRYVKADSQAEAAKAFLAGAQEAVPDDRGDAGKQEAAAVGVALTPEEAAVVKRARNRTDTPTPRGSSPKAYKLATGLEALIGWLYAKGDEDRLGEICKAAMEVTDSRADEVSKGGTR